MEIQRFNKTLKGTVVIGDLFLLDVIFLLCFYFANNNAITIGSSDFLLRQIILQDLCYLVCNAYSGVILYHRLLKPDQIAIKVLRNVVLYSLLSLSIMGFTCTTINFSFQFFILFYSLLAISIFIYRISVRHLLKRYRSRGNNIRPVLLAGSNNNIVELYHSLADDSTSGYRVMGYFEDFPSNNFPDEVKYLGKIDEIIPYLKLKSIHNLYCCLPSSREKEIVPIINYCENHFIRFYSVPNIHNYLKRQMHLEIIGNVPVLSIRNEPLATAENQLLKRLFDIIFSLIFLCTIFPIIYVIIGIAIKRSSPGPIIFKQKRTGQDGKEFMCYKFRSMKINTESDTMQATKDDPRKTRVGDFIRKTNIDEMPQFINVLLGSMSVVGPRPHMLKHTEEYSKLINKFMVRHYVKPGLTGWAQITGFRGETQELWQMEGRVQRDIWYIEHWTFILDLYIIYKTIANILHGDKEAY